MPSSDTQVTITEGFPVSDPWIISELDTNLKNLALARLVALGANQGAALRKQTAVLNEQTNQLDALSATAKDVGAGSKTALVVDDSGKILIRDANIVSDLIGRDPAKNEISVSDADRLIQFTSHLASSAPPVNLGGKTYAELTVSSGSPPADIKMQVPVVLWPNDPNNDNSSAFQPLVYYVNKSPDGTLNGVIYSSVGANAVKLTVNKVSFPSVADTSFVYDAYKINIGTTANPNYEVVPVKNVFGTFPAASSSDVLYRDLSTGTLRLIGPTSTNRTYTNAQGFVIPSSKDELYYWFGQAASARLAATTTQFTNDGIKLPVDPNAVQWKYAASTNFTGGGFAYFPITTGDPTSVSLPINSLVQNNGKTYLITGRTGSANSYIEVDLVGSPIVLVLSQDNLVNIRGQYTEVITRATQRTTEQQLFLNSLLQKQNYHLDAATNVLKAFNDMTNRQAGLL
jgi:hypothetical protein